MNKLHLLVWGISCLTILEIVAMCFGINGQLFATVISAVVGLCGYAFGKKEEELLKEVKK